MRHQFVLYLHLYFSGTQLSYSDKVIDLGQVLTSTLDDTADIMRAVKDMNRKINSLLFIFYFLVYILFRLSSHQNFCFKAFVW